MNGVNHTRLLRVAFFAALVLTAYFAFTPVTHAGIEQVYDKTRHLAAFLVLAALIDWSFPALAINRKLLALLAYGVLIEVVQYFLPYRMFSVFDMGADALGLALYRLGRPVAGRILAGR